MPTCPVADEITDFIVTSVGFGLFGSGFNANGSFRCFASNSNGNVTLLDDRPVGGITITGPFAPNAISLTVDQAKACGDSLDCNFDIPD